MPTTFASPYPISISHVIAGGNMMHVRLNFRFCPKAKTEEDSGQDMAWTTLGIVGLCQDSRFDD